MLTFDPDARRARIMPESLEGGKTKRAPDIGRPRWRGSGAVLVVGLCEDAGDPFLDSLTSAPFKTSSK